MEVKGQKALTQDLIRIKSSLESLESALKSLQESTPQDPEEIQETEGRICTLCTTEAMNLLEKGEFTTSLSLLKRAESLSTVARAETLLEVLQLLSCYYGRLGKPIRALSYLDRAHEIEQSLPYFLSRGKTHLNYCAVLSQMNRHDDALQHALKAVMTLQDEVLCAAMRGQSISGARMEEMAVAYYNLAVEYEFKSEYSEAEKWFEKSVSFAKAHLPLDNPYLLDLSKKEEAFMSKMRALRARTEERRKKREKPKEDSAAYLTDLKKRIQTERLEEWKSMRRGPGSKSGTFLTDSERVRSMSPTFKNTKSEATERSVKSKNEAQSTKEKSQESEAVAAQEQPALPSSEVPASSS